MDLSRYSTQDLENFYRDVESYEEARKSSPISFYEPNPMGQQAFHNSPKRIRVLLGGNRSGKTTAGGAEAVAHSLGFRPWLPENHPLYVVTNADGDPIAVPNTGTILGESFKVAVERTLWPKIEEWVPPSLIARTQKNQQGVVDKLELTNGSIMQFMAYNQADKEFEGFRVHWAWYDEPPPRNVFIANERSLVDFSGRSWFTMTPIRQAWFFQDIVSNSEESENVDVFTMSSWDNPHVSKRSLENYFSYIKDPALRRSRELGVALHLQGRVFPWWEAQKPYYIPYFQPPWDWARACAIDPHPRKPIAIIWVAISPTSGFWYAYREMYDETVRTVAQCAEKIKSLERGEKVAFRIIDPSSQENEKTSDSSVYEQFQNHDIACELALRWDKEGRIRKLGDFLGMDPVYKRPQLVVMDSCRRLKFELLNYIWDDWAPQFREQKEQKSEVVKKDDDLIDGLMYLLQWGEEARDFDPQVKMPSNRSEDRIVRPEVHREWR